MPLETLDFTGVSEGDREKESPRDWAFTRVKFNIILHEFFFVKRKARETGHLHFNAPVYSFASSTVKKESPRNWAFTLCHLRISLCRPRVKKERLIPR